jgi:hypothetical protein
MESGILHEYGSICSTVHVAISGERFLNVPVCSAVQLLLMVNSHYCKDSNAQTE